MFTTWSTFKILCYQRLFLKPWRALQRSPLFAFFLQFISLDITSRPAKVTKSWSISLVPSHMEHLDVPHDVFHSYFLRRKKKIWQRGTASLWSLGHPDQKTPCGSPRSKAGTVGRCIIYCLHLCTSPWMAPLSGEGCTPSVQVFCYHIFPSFLPSFHLPIYKSIQ